MFKNISAVLTVLVLCAGMVSAACFGPYCWDGSNTGLIDSLSVTTLNAGLPSKTLAQMNLLVPGAAGQLIFVSDGLQSKVCVSTGTGAGAYVVVAATSAAVIGGLTGHCN